MYQKILIPIDGSSTADRALQEGLQLAKHHNAQIGLVHVTEDISLQSIEVAEYYDELLEAIKMRGHKVLEKAQKAAQDAGITTETQLLDATGERITDIIIAEAKRWSADLIVIGTHGHTGFSRLLLGSVAEGVVRSAHIPVLLIRSE